MNQFLGNFLKMKTLQLSTTEEGYWEWQTKEGILTVLSFTSHFNPRLGWIQNMLLLGKKVFLELRSKLGC